MKNKGRSVTIRISNKLYEELKTEAILKSVKENRLVNISEIIREKLNSDNV